MISAICFSTHNSNSLSLPSELISVKLYCGLGDVVHSGERLTGSQKVGGSNPPVSTRNTDWILEEVSRGSFKIQILESF